MRTKGRRKIEKKKSLTALKKELDRIFSLYIRHRDEGVCFTCGKKAPIEKMQAGHYVSRSVLSLRYDPLNVHCQCVGCNVFKHGNYPKYALRLIQESGAGILDYLEKKSKQIKRFSRQEYITAIEHFKILLKLYE